MRFFSKTKDGGPESPVIAYFLLEIKSLFSVVLLHFPGSRENYHSHAFNAWTLWLKGRVRESVSTIQSLRASDSDLSRYVPKSHDRDWRAGEVKYTPRHLTHKILPITPAWALSIRGPWKDRWTEVTPEGRTITLTHGRKIVPNV